MKADFGLVWDSFPRHAQHLTELTLGLRPPESWWPRPNFDYLQYRAKWEDFLTGAMLGLTPGGLLTFFPNLTVLRLEGVSLNHAGIEAWHALNGPKLRLLSLLGCQGAFKFLENVAHASRPPQLHSFYYDSRYFKIGSRVVRRRHSVIASAVSAFLLSFQSLQHLFLATLSLYDPTPILRGIANHQESLKRLVVMGSCYKLLECLDMAVWPSPIRQAFGMELESCSVGAPLLHTERILHHAKAHSSRYLRLESLD